MGLGEGLPGRAWADLMEQMRSDPGPPADPPSHPLNLPQRASRRVMGYASKEMPIVHRSHVPNVLMVSPRFTGQSFWNYRETCAVVGARYVAAPLGLITVAALLPKSWPVRLIDRNTSALRDEDLQWADVVMIGGMLSQQPDAKQVIALAHAHHTPVVVGGPDVTLSPGVYEEAEFRVLGEAEDIMGDFVAAWLAGERRGVFAAKSFPKLTASPVPRFDLLHLRDYMHVGVQYGRGCPFHCEFCSVIELNGRAPRQKSPAQILAELDALYELGYRGHVDFVDDNLIGNRKAVGSLLAALTTWRARHGYPFEFTSEVCLSLADDEELLLSMARAGFFAVFVGIETPDPRVLRSTQKAHNTQKDIAASIRRINRAGMFVNAGFIVGFDGEAGPVADSMIACIEDAAIPICMVGLLYALPNTQLSRRLQMEGRLHANSDRGFSDSDADQCTSGLNYQTERPRTEILRDYRAVIEAIYAPRAFFARVRRLNRALDLSRHRVRTPLRRQWRDLRSLAKISWKLGVRDREARGAYWRTFGDCLTHNPRSIRSAVTFAALYLHIKPYARFLQDRLARQIAFPELDPLPAPSTAGPAMRQRSAADRRVDVVLQ